MLVAWFSCVSLKHTPVTLNIVSYAASFLQGLAPLITQGSVQKSIVWFHKWENIVYSCWGPLWYNGLRTHPGFLVAHPSLSSARSEAGGEVDGGVTMRNRGLIQRCGESLTWLWGSEEFPQRMQVYYWVVKDISMLLAEWREKDFLGENN